MALGSNNIKFSDVKSILGESTDTLSGLCTSNKINKWSKWKPIQSDTPLTESIVNTSSCGMTYGKFANFSACVQAIKNGTAMNIHTYNKPTSNYRLGDFRNYEHNTYKGFLHLNCYVDGQTLKAYSTDSASKLFTEYSNSSDSTKNLMNGDLYATGIVWRANDPTIGITRINTTKLNSSSGIIGVDLDIDSIKSNLGIADGTSEMCCFSLIICTPNAVNTRYKTFSTFSGNESNNITALSNDYCMVELTNSQSSPGKSFSYQDMGISTHIVTSQQAYSQLQKLSITYKCVYSGYGNTTPNLTYSLVLNNTIKKTGQLQLENSGEIVTYDILTEDDQSIQFNSIVDNIKVYIYLDGLEWESLDIHIAESEN